MSELQCTSCGAIFLADSGMAPDCLVCTCENKEFKVMNTPQLN